MLLDEFPSKAVFDHCVRWSKNAEHNIYIWSKPWDNAGGGGLLFVTHGKLVRWVSACEAVAYIVLCAADELSRHLTTIDLDE